VWVLGHLAADTFAIFAVFAQQTSKRRVVMLAAASLAAALLSITALHQAAQVERNIASPPIWDARCFWTYARAIVLFHKPYDTTAMHHAAKMLPYDRGFTREVLDVGFEYPPPTAAVIAPLGLFATPRAAAPYWYGLIVVALLAQILLLWRHFLRSDGWLGLAAAAMITLFLPLTSAVLSMGQTVFLAEVFLLLYLSARDEWRQGFFLALGTIVKPYLVLVFLYPILRGRWRVVLSSAVAIVAVTMLALPLIGWTSIVSYLTSPPISRWAAYMETITSNQSLLAWLLRMEHRSPPLTAALHDPLYIVLSIALVIVTIWRVRSLRADRDYAATLLVIVAIAICPAPVWYYAAMLSVPICLLWSRRHRIQHGSIIAWAFTAAIFLLAGRENGQFFAVLLAWSVMWALPSLAADARPAQLHSSVGARAHGR
jgi:Glycosyltransferase family 87